jgi:hypothetical protein
MDNGKVTDPKPKTLDEFLALFDPSVHDIIRNNLKPKGVSGVVCYDNIQLDSLHFGARSAFIYGPTCTYKDLETCLGGRIGETPSRFQYPTLYPIKPKPLPPARPRAVTIRGVFPYQCALLLS